MPDSSHAGGPGGNDAFILIMEQGDMALTLINTKILTMV